MSSSSRQGRLQRDPDTGQWVRKRWKEESKAQDLKDSPSEGNPEEGVLQTISDAESRELLLNGRGELVVWRKYVDRIGRGRASMEEQLLSVQNDVESTFRKAYIAGIESGPHHEEFDECERSTTTGAGKLKAVRKGTGGGKVQGDSFDKSRRKLIDKLAELRKTYRRRFDELEKNAQKKVQDLQGILLEIGALEDDSGSLLHDGQKILSLLKDTTGKEPDEDALNNVLSSVEGVTFVKGVGDAFCEGRIDWAGGEWVIAGTMSVPQRWCYPDIVGCISEDEVVMYGYLLKAYVTDVSSKNFRAVSPTNTEYAVIASCAVLDDELIVCGVCLMTSSEGAAMESVVRLVSRQWQPVKGFDLPEIGVSSYPQVDVLVYQNKIIASQAYTSNIYVLDPSDGTVLNKFTFEFKVRMRDVLPSGEIVVQRHPFNNTLTLINLQGATREISHCEPIANVTADPLTGDLYISCVITSVYQGHSSRTCLIYHIPMKGGETKKILSAYVVSPEVGFMQVEQSRLVFTNAGKIVRCNEHTIYVYRKTLPRF